MDHKRQAIVDYLEFGLVHFLKKYEQQIDPKLQGSFYADAYSILNDLDETMAYQRLLENPPSTNNES